MLKHWWISKPLYYMKTARSKRPHAGASLVAQWLRIHLPRQGTRVWALVREDPTCRRSTKPVSHNYWACVPQLLKPTHLETMLRNKRSHCNEKPAHRNYREPTRSKEDPTQPKIKKTKQNQKQKKTTCWNLYEIPRKGKSRKFISGIGKWPQMGKRNLLGVSKTF